jgi:hypothetical protein
LSSVDLRIYVHWIEVKIRLIRGEDIDTGYKGIAVKGTY